MVGARIGAAPITSMSFDISFAAPSPSARSRTMARGITALAAPPKAATQRQAASTAMSLAMAQPIVATV